MTQQEINNTSMLKVGTILHGTYRIDSYLSSGGFGNTYVATNIEFEERVAIKEFFMKGVTQRDDNQTTVSVSNTENRNSFLEQKEKFKKEARRIRQLRNEHIVNVHDLFEENGTAYYVMDYVDGENLAERMKKTGRPMTESEVRLILPQILDALKAVHDTGIWHLDLKPANIMLEKDGIVKLIDFGASKQLNAQKGGATTSTAISYTNGYAPREQMEQNYDKFGPWTDIYALGATLYNLLTNKRPPLPSDIDDDDSEDKHQSLPFPDGISDGMKKLVLQLMHTNRKNRPQSVSDVMPLLVQQPEEIKKVVEKPIVNQTKESDDSEVTIISTPQSEETVIERKNEEESKPKVDPIPTSAAEKPHTPYEYKEDETGKGKTAFIIGAAIVVLFFIIIGFNNGCGNEAQEPAVQQVENTDPKVVTRMTYETALGGCQYSGPVDDLDKPNGDGEAFFNDGRYYRGGFEHGVMTGDNCYFKYSNGDVFTGKFRKNSFYYGRYTVAEDKSYFVGAYKNGQPDGGTWYDKNGKIIQ
jgi:serine/threonine protein kinase